MSKADSHICFGCSEPIRSNQPHIHVPLDEWSAGEGLSSFGLGDLLTFPFCEPCTVREARPGWNLEAHEVP